jgi:hypothetical protein
MVFAAKPVRSFCGWSIHLLNGKGEYRTSDKPSSHAW